LANTCQHPRAGDVTGIINRIAVVNEVIFFIDACLRKIINWPVFRFIILIDEKFVSVVPTGVDAAAANARSPWSLTASKPVALNAFNITAFTAVMVKLMSNKPFVLAIASNLSVLAAAPEL
jgi:hypothetical protein